MKYYFKEEECMYIKQISETQCEYIKLEFVEHQGATRSHGGPSGRTPRLIIIPIVDSIQTDHEHNIEIFLQGTRRISEELYTSIYNRLTA